MRSTVSFNFRVVLLFLRSGALVLCDSGRTALEGAYRNLSPLVTYSRDMADWDGLHQRARERYEDGEARLPDDPDARQKQLTRMGNAAGAAGLTALMAGADGSKW